MGRKRTDSTRRAFLKTAGAAAGTVFMRKSLWAQNLSVEGASPTRTGALGRINRQFMMTPDQAWEWNAFKSQGGPTYAGGAGWKRFTDFLISKMPEFGAVDLDSVDIPYDHYIVDDWPDRRTHIYDSGIAVEKLVTDGTPVPVVASYGMTSGINASRRHHRADALLRSRASAGERSNRRKDSRVPDGAVSGAALQRTRFSTTTR